jgi:glycine/D-amino acid oxidase-like deaminating enzyme
MYGVRSLRFKRISSRGSYQLKAHFPDRTPVLDTKLEDGREHSVITCKGKIECEYIINAAGSWAYK